MRSLKLLSIMLITIMLTGCMKMNMDMTIGKDKSMDFSVVIALTNSLANGENTLSDSEIARYEENGFTVENYSDESYTGYTIKKKIANIDDISSENATVFDMNKFYEGEKIDDMFTVKKGFLKNTYNVVISEDMSDLQDDTLYNAYDETNDASDNIYSTYDETNDISDNTLFDYSEESMSSLLNGLDIKFTVNLPYQAISSNATSTQNDGKTLVWTPSVMTASAENMEFSFEIYNMTNIYILIGVAIVLVIIIVLIIKKSFKRKNVHSNNLNSANTL